MSSFGSLALLAIVSCASGTRIETLWNDGWLFYFGGDLSWNCSSSASEFVFPINLTNAEVLGLSQVDAANAIDCEASCGCACQVWQWCGASECSVQNTCWTGLLGDYGPYNYVTISPGWIGGARLQPPAPPTQLSSPGSGAAFDDSSWQPVVLPFDYLASQPSTNSTAPHVQEHGGISFSDAWFRKHFTVPADMSMLRIDFDGVYRSSAIFLNGVLVLQHEEGYTGFSMWLHNVTGAPLNLDGGDNVLSIHIDDTTYSYELWSYEGAGITRDVHWALFTTAQSIAPWGVFVPSSVAPGATVFAPRGSAGPMWGDGVVTPLVDIASEGQGGGFQVSCSVIAPDGITVVAGPLFVNGSFPDGGGWQRLTFPEMTILNASLWFPASSAQDEDRPLYTLVTSYYFGAPASPPPALVDSVNVSIGIRSVTYTATNGIFINGLPVKVRGFSVHQDAGGSGSFVPPSVVAYRMQQLLGLGSNAFRTAHCPFASSVLDEADRRGVLVWSEARFLRMFDVYTQDALDMVLRDRNHPSVIFWSLCNENGCGEVPNQEGAVDGAVAGFQLATKYMDAMRAADWTRPFTANSHDTIGANGSILYALDVMGLTYDYSGLDVLHAARPTTPVMNGESASCQSQRATTDLDSVLSCTVDAWNASQSRDWSLGAFVWSGWDYGGESGWPNSYSQYGVMDVCGFDKPIANWYKAWWGFLAAGGSTAAGSFLAGSPEWSMFQGQKNGSSVTIYAFSSASLVQLFVNGIAVNAAQPVPFLEYLSWSVPYEQGNYTLVAYNASGAIVSTFTSQSADAPEKLSATIEWPGSGPDGALLAGGIDTAIVTVAIVDASGIIASMAAANVTFTISGPGSLLGACNGDQEDHLPRQGLSYRNTYVAQLRIFVRSALVATGEPVVATFSAYGLESTSISINVV